MDRVYLDKIEFYITNVCNLTCNNCNRFNNHNFKGFQRWEDVEPLMEEWAKYIDFNHGVIIGGEPLLNSSIIQWVKGINRIWGHGVQILSNGTRLHKVKELYNLLAVNNSIRGRNVLGISWHNEQTIDTMFEEIKSFMHGKIDVKEGKENTGTGADWQFKDENGVSIGVWMQNEFGQASVIPTGDGKWTLWNNEGQEEAVHAGCGMAQYKCYHFAHGKFHKCASVALWPEFDEQIGLELSDSDRKLAYGYKPLTIEDARNGKTKEFFEHIDEVIPQCKFCPTGWLHTPEIIYSVEKKDLS